MKRIVDSINSGDNSKTGINIGKHFDNMSSEQKKKYGIITKEAKIADEFMERSEDILRRFR